jgi:hypothetical protein
MRNPGRAEIARAVPPGSRRARSQPAALLALQADPALAELRADYAHNIREVWRLLVRYARWREMTTSPTRARICEQLGIGLSTWKRCRAWLEEHGWLGCVVAGSTPELDGMRTSPAFIPEDAPNTAAVYVLAIPREKRILPPPVHDHQLSGPPAGSRRDPGKDHARATAAGQEIGPASRPGSLPAMAAAVRTGAGQGITDGWAAWLARPFAHAGWTAGDLRYAVEHEPGGGQHRGRWDRVAHPVGWLRWRLARWLGPGGVPLPSHGQDLAAAAQRLRAGQQARRERMAAAAAAWTDPAPRAAAIREQLGWRK